MMTFFQHQARLWISAFSCATGMALGSNVWVDLEKISATDRHEVYRLKGEATSIQEVRHVAGHYWAMGQNGTIYRSADFNLWERLSIGSNQTLLHLLEAENGTLLVRGSGNPTDHFFSTDGGKSWHSVTRTAKKVGGLADPEWLKTAEHLWVDGGRFRMATFSPRGILESWHGADWRSIAVQTPAIPQFSNMFRKRLDDLEYLVLLNHAVYSSQNGSSWHREPVDSFTSSGMWLEAFQGRHVFAIAFTGTNPQSKIHVKSAQTSWQSSDPFGQAALHALVQDDGYLWALTSTDGRKNHTVWRSADATTWEPFVEGIQQLTVRLGTSPKGVLAGGLNSEIHLFPRGEGPNEPAVQDRFAELNQAPEAPPARPLAQPEGSIEKGLKLIEAAEGGDVRSREALVAALLEGNGFYQNAPQAEFLIERWKLSESRFAYSLALNSESASPPDYMAARAYFLKAANAGNVEAALKFGTYAQRGIGGKVDARMANHWLDQVVRRGTKEQKAEAEKRIDFLAEVRKAEAGDLDAALRVGKEYTLDKSELVNLNWATARKYLRAALAGGRLEAGTLMLLRPETPEDGRDIRLKMAELGDEHSMVTVASNLLQGKFTFPKDPVLAGKYVMKLAAGGHQQSKLLVARVMLGFNPNEMEFKIDRELGRKYLKEVAAVNFAEAPMLLAYFHAREARGAKLAVDGNVSGLPTPVMALLKTWGSANKAELTQQDMIDLFRAVWRDADYSRAEENLAAELRAANGKVLAITGADGSQLRLAKAPRIPASIQPSFDRLFPDDWQVGEFTEGEFWMNFTASPGFIVCAARLHPNLAAHYQNTLAQQAMNEARKPGWDPLKAYQEKWRGHLGHLDEAGAAEMRAMLERGLNDVRNALQRGGKPDMPGFPAL